MFCCCLVSQSFSFVTPWAVAHQASLSMRFLSQEYWKGLPFPSPGDLPTQELKLGLLHCRQILYWLSYQGSLILYIENPKYTTRKLPELINVYSKDSGYKIYTQKSLAFLYTKNEETEKLRKQFHSPLQRK